MMNLNLHLILLAALVFTVQAAEFEPIQITATRAMEGTNLVWQVSSSPSERIHSVIVEERGERLIITVRVNPTIRKTNAPPQKATGATRSFQAPPLPLDPERAAEAHARSATPPPMDPDPALDRGATYSPAVPIRNYQPD